MLKKFINNIIEKKLKEPSKRGSKRNGRRKVSVKESKDKTQTIWWFLAKRFEDENKFRDVSSSIGYFMCGKNSSVLMAFSDIVVVNDTIFIYTRRPGLLIGKAGETIEKLTKTINTNVDGKKIHDYKIHIIEDKGRIGVGRVINDMWFYENNF